MRAMSVRGGFLTVEEAEMQTRAAYGRCRHRGDRGSQHDGRHFAGAEQLIARHGYTYRLRTLDALQLAVALEQGLLDKFVVADKVLGKVTHYEGLAVLNPETLNVAVLRLTGSAIK